MTRKADEYAALDVPPIVSERLNLVWMSPAFMHTSLAGRRDEARAMLGALLPDTWPENDVRGRLEMRLDQMTKDPASAEWLLRLMVRREDGKVIGLINFHGQPDAEQRAELGYTVFAAERRQGYATEAALAMMAWARARHGIRRFVVSISPTNLPSLALAAKLGGRRTGTQIDEVDGEEYVFELSLS